MNDHIESFSGHVNWLNRGQRLLLEKAVARYTGCDWKIKSERELFDVACHPCVIVSDKSYDVFVKFSKADNANEQFKTELSGLQFLHKKADVNIPQPIDIICTDNGTLLIMEALQEVERKHQQWKDIGVTLARIHNVKSDYIGFERDGFLGPLYQDNRPAGNWITFFRERRLQPRLVDALNSGNLPVSIAKNIEKIINRLPELCGPEMTPTLLHGDAQQNNYISTANGTYIIDPAIYYGNAEMDLALIDSFQPVPKIVFEGYRDLMPIDREFYRRRDLWRVPLYLAAVAIEGTIHLDRLTASLRTYL